MLYDLQSDLDSDEFSTKMFEMDDEPLGRTSPNSAIDLPVHGEARQTIRLDLSRDAPGWASTAPRGSESHKIPRRPVRDAAAGFSAPEQITAAALLWGGREAAACQTDAREAMAWEAPAYASDDAWSGVAQSLPPSSGDLERSVHGGTMFKFLAQSVESCSLHRSACATPAAPTSCHAPPPPWAPQPTHLADAHKRMRHASRRRQRWRATMQLQGLTSIEESPIHDCPG